MSHSSKIITLAASMLALAILACQAPQQTAPAPTSAPVQAVPSSTPTTASPEFPTVTPIPSSTLVPTPTESLTPTATTGAPGGAGGRTPTARPSGPAPKLDFTLDDIDYSQSPQRKPDNKVQMTVKLHPRGGLPPYSMMIDGKQVDGLIYTFDWHNCNESEPHSFIVISADGQRSKPVNVILPYHC